MDNNGFAGFWCRCPTNKCEPQGPMRDNPEAAIAAWNEMMARPEAQAQVTTNDLKRVGVPASVRGKERRQRREEAGLVKVNPKLKREPSVAALLAELKRLRMIEGEFKILTRDLKLWKAVKL